jgi:hypothetical protein
MHEDLLKAADALNLSLPNLKAAATNTERDVAEFKSSVSAHWSNHQTKVRQEDITDVDLILLGSIARQEATAESDCDYFILQNGCTPDISRKILSIAHKVRTDLGFAPPGRQAVFGDIVIAANLYERIGLESDTNQNLTHRMLLLTESTSVFSTSTYDNVIDKILGRYCADYQPPLRKEKSSAKVPRYLVNDLVRFWRTMAVDFGAKRWRSTEGNDSYLRLIKLRTTRKILFAGPFCSLLLVPERIKLAEELPAYLRACLKKPPLAQLASIASDQSLAPRLSESSKKALKDLLEAYDNLIGLFNERGARHVLKNPDSAVQPFKEKADKCEQIAQTIQTCLELIFFDDPVFKGCFRKYSVF